jgi:NAD(P)H dehydrogenase (quinone)
VKNHWSYSEMEKMLKVLVVYDSRTGNTKKMASAVAEGAKKVSDVEVTVKKAEQTSPDDFLAADAIVMGSPTLGRCQPNSKP